MEELLMQLLLQALERALMELAEEGIKWIVKKVTDEAGRVTSQIIYMLDTDGDGVGDTEQIVYTLEHIMPDLSEGFCICNDGDEIGIGYPALRLVDASEVLPMLDPSDIISGSDEGFLIDLDGDGLIDEPVYPVPIDYTGDGQDDFFVVVDDDDNGLPDAAPTLPFYPIGSDGYYEIVGREDEGIMTKDINDYSVSEGLLLLLLLISAGFAVRSLFHRKEFFK